MPVKQNIEIFAKYVGLLLPYDELNIRHFTAHISKMMKPRHSRIKNEYQVATFAFHLLVYKMTPPTDIGYVDFMEQLEALNNITHKIFKINIHFAM